MLRSWKIGTIAGIGMYIHWTFLLLVLFAFMNAGGWNEPQASLFAVIFLIAVFCCVVLHEFGHALMARQFGIPTLDITLYPIGGVARLERMSERPWEEFWIAAAGPAVNLVIAAVCIGCLLLMGVQPALRQDVRFSPNGFLFLLALANLGLLAFNLLPAFPMDGGRILRALLASRLGQLRATTIAVHLGKAMALIFVLCSFMVPTLLLIALFVFLAGEQQLALVRQQAAQAAIPRDVIPVDADWQVPPNFNGVTWDRTRGVMISWRDGHPVQVMTVR